MPPEAVKALPPLRLRVALTEAGERLDKLVVRHAPGVGRRRATELFAEGRVRVDGRHAKKSDLAREGTEVEVDLGGPDQAAAEPDAPLDVRLETEDLVVVSKPAGQPSVALRGSEHGTLAGALLGRYPEMKDLGSPREAGLVHRLDTQTSGLLAAARTRGAYERLRSAISAGAVTKKYLALVPGAGLPGSGIIDQEIAPHPRDRRRVTVGEDLSGARPAETRWRVLERGPSWALVEAEAPRAVRHQIRAHLASIGHPLAGDVLYGGALLEALGERHALHASYLAWGGDAKLEGFELFDPLPSELRALLAPDLV